MSGSDEVTSAVKEVSKEFGKLLIESSNASEKRHAKTDDKLDKLIDVMSENILIIRETKKDQAYLFERVDRAEVKLDRQDSEIRDLGERMIISDERQKTAKESRVRLIGWISTISSSVIGVAIIAWWNLK